MKKKVEIRLNPKQEEFLRKLNDRRYKYGFYIGGMGAGKTFIGCLAGLLYSISYSDSLGLVGRYVERELEATTKDTLIRLAKKLGVYKGKNEHKGEVYVYARGSEGSDVSDTSTILVWCLMAQRREDERKFLSLELSWFFIDEASELRDDRIYKMLCSRLRRVSGIRKGWVASNPVPTSHWLYNVANESGDTFVVHASMEDNWMYLPADYIEAMKRMDDSWRAVYVEGKWGAVRSVNSPFNVFSRRVHVFNEDEFKVDLGAPVYRGWDFGFKHPACVWFQVDEYGRFLVFREFLGQTMTLQSFVGRVLAISNREFAGADFIDYGDIQAFQMVDVAYGMSRAEFLRRFGIALHGRLVTDEEGIEVIGRLLTTHIDGRPMLMFSDKCHILIDAFTGGLELDKAGRIKNSGIYVHLWDALKYGICNVVSRSPIQKIDWREIKTPTWLNEFVLD